MAHQPHAGRRGEGQGAPLTGGGDTIAALATPAGRGGIGVVRISGPGARALCERIAGSVPPPRHAQLATFRAADGAPVDEGLVLFFPAPHSYTGEDVVELQGHGGPVVLQQLLRACLESGARMAEPGEYTRRAFLNGRLDLAQAESVADLIDASSVEAARSAARSLTGEFSARVRAIVEAVTDLRMHIEACIDFPEEEIDPADREARQAKLSGALDALETVLRDARQGAVLREGLTVVLAGRPNVGKSSLLNRLAGEEVAIVTPIPGTTRDYVRASITLQGVPIHLVDTAGLREASDEVERIGVARSWQALDIAGAAVFVEDGTGPAEEEAALKARFPQGLPTVHVLNKIDARGEPARREEGAGGTVIALSAKTGEGVELLRHWLLATAGWKPHGEGVFMARERHLAALEAAREGLLRARATAAFELQAEELRLAQRELGRITGEVSADDLLGRIFAGFCIGK